MSGRQAAEAVRARIGWKYALGLELTDAGFGYSVLSEFRDRLVIGSLEQSLLDTILERAVTAGLLRAGGRQRTDSTHVLMAMRTMNRLEQVHETVRAALSALAAASPTGSWPRPNPDGSSATRPALRTIDCPRTKLSASSSATRSAPTGTASCVRCTRRALLDGCATSPRCRSCATYGSSSTSPSTINCAGEPLTSSRQALSAKSRPATPTPRT
ncbi:transposase [Nonomuraea pusilla]|uniref:transposase n=1 Tax=Nonomuraea pusilla TaxID=46177 RepID=UPI0011607628